LFLAVAQNIFSNTLILRISGSVPEVNPQIIINAGATDLHKALTPDQLTKVLVVFMNSLRDAFVVPISLTGVGFFSALMLNKNMRIKGGIKLAGTT